MLRLFHYWYSWFLVIFLCSPMPSCIKLAVKNVVKCEMCLFSLWWVFNLLFNWWFGYQTTWNNRIYLDSSLSFFCTSAVREAVHQQNIFNRKLSVLALYENTCWGWRCRIVTFLFNCVFNVLNVVTMAFKKETIIPDLVLPKSKFWYIYPKVSHVQVHY